MELKNFKRYQHINSLLVRCSEAGNVSAQFLLGKVILVSSFQLLLGELLKVERDLQPCDFATLNELSFIFATNDSTQNQKVGSFMAYFLPKQVSTSELSHIRLVHYQLVRLFLLKGSLQDLAEMSVFLKSYVRLFTSVTEEDRLLLICIEALVSHADRFRCFEKRLLKVNRHIAGWEGCEGILNAIRRSIDWMKSSFAESRTETLRFFDIKFG